MGFVSSCRLVVASPPRRRGPQVRAPWHHEGHGAVDVVGPVAPPGRASGHGWGTQECTQIGGNDLSAQFRVICVHCCAVVDRRENAGVYTNQRKRSLGAVLGHLCTLLRHEPHRVARVPQPPWRAGGVPSVATSRLVGKTGPARMAPPLAWRLRRGVNPHKPPRNPN